MSRETGTNGTRERAIGRDGTAQTGAGGGGLEAWLRPASGLKRRSSSGQQVVQHRLPGRAGQRQYAAPAGLRREDDDLVVRPVDVVQPQRPDLAPAQAVAGDQQQHGIVAPPVRLTNAGHAEQATHLLPRQGAGHVGEPVAPARWHSAHQVRPAAARRAAVTATPRQMTGEEIRDDPLIANPVASPLFVQVPAEMTDGMPVIPARPPGVAALAQPLDQPNGLRFERGLLPAHVEQPIPERFVHRPPP
jgi:hypothetical protein